MEINMKRSVKILITLCVLSAIAVCAGFAVFAESYTGTVAELSAKITAAENASAISAKASALDAVAQYLSSKPVDPQAEGYADAKARLDRQVIIVGNSYALECDVSLGSARNVIKVNQLKAFLKKFTVSESTPGYDDFKYNCDSAIADQLKLEADTRLANEAKLDVSEYELPIMMNVQDYTTRKDMPTIGNLSSNFLGIESNKDGDNAYLTIRYTVQSHTFGVYNITNNKNGFVIEFDFTTFGQIPPSGVRFENGSVTNSNNVLVYPHYFDIDKNGNVIDGIGNTLITSAIVPGEWVHFALCYNPVSFTYSLYMNEQFLGEWTALVSGGTYSMSKFRFGRNNNSGEFSIDNFTSYEGTGPRTHDRMESMSDSEKFLFYSAVFIDGTNKIATRNTAYQYASELIALFYDEANQQYLTEDASVRAAVDKYLAFDYEELISVYKSENLKEYIALVNKLTAIARRMDNIGNRETAVSEIENFVKINEGMILTNDQYRAAELIVSDAADAIAKDKVIDQFVLKMQKFDRSTTLASMQRHYEAAKEFYNEGLDLSVLDAEGYESFKAAYASYVDAGERVAQATREFNSEKIVACVGLLAEFDTEEEWIANYDYINGYVLIVRNELRANNYDPAFPGLEDAIAIFTPIDDYFYLDLQKQHIAFISAELERFRSTEAYIERLGICALITSYVERNDIDYTNEEIAVLLNTHQTYIGEVEIQKDDYHTVLTQNSAYFINLVNLMQTKSGYAEVKPIFDEAYEYYYALDAAAEGAREAIAIFDSYKEALALIESSSQQFIAAVALLDPDASADILYARLVVCCDYARYVDTGIDGVSEALEIYTEIYNDYNGIVSAANSDLSAAGVVVGSVRAFVGLSPIVAAIIKLIFG